jgi:hypothetical protein
LESVSIRGSVVQYTAQGCPPILAYHYAACRHFNHNALTVIEHARIQHVVLAADWSEYRRKDVELVLGTLDALRDLGVETTLIGQSPTFFMDPALIAARRGEATAANASAPLAINNAALNVTLRSHAGAAGARFIDPMEHLCPREPCPIRVAGLNLYLDYGHFTLAGSARAVQAYFPYVER